MEEIGETAVSLPSVTKINDEINFIIKTNIKQYVSTVLKEISEEYHIPLDRLHDQYLTDDMLYVYCGTPDLKNKKTRKRIDPDDQCHAKTASGIRCSRKHRTGEKFCGSHINMYPEEYISVDLPADDQIPKQKISVRLK